MWSTGGPSPEVGPERRGVISSVDARVLVGRRSLPILVQDPVDDFRDSVSSDIDTPAFLADGIV